jgi:thymidylate synthase
MREERDLGEIYSFLWNHWETNENIVKVDPVDTSHIKKTTQYPLFELKSPEQSDDELVGSVHKTPMGYEFIVLSKGNREDGRKAYNIQFTYTGYVANNTRADLIKNGNIKDPYHPLASGVGYTGGSDPITPVYGIAMYKNLQSVWVKMLERCYSQKCKEYKYYGAKGVFVDARWHSFENFLNDVTKLPGWTAKLRHPNKYEIDKDHYNAGVYSKDTCVWLPHNHNILYRDARPFFIINKDGDKKLYISKTKCAKDNDLIIAKICLVLDGKRKHHKGYKFEYLNDGNIYRYQLPINQLKNAIDTLKTNPTDRRMVVSAWNPSVFHKQALHCCHYSYQFVSDGKHLDLIYNFRSNDLVLGNNFTMYATLLSLVATQVNMIPRYLVYSGADVHIYVNHIEGVKEQVSREPKQLPQLKIIKNKEDWSIWDWDSQTDWELIGYDPHPAIKFEVAV